MINTFVYMLTKAEENKRIGVWLDHSIAFLMAYKDSIKVQTIRFSFSYREKMASLEHNESVMQRKDHQLQNAYYQEIGASILPYDRVLLFGPTTAKVELHHYLMRDRHFAGINFDIIDTDKMTENEREAFVRQHFDNGQ